MNPAILAFKDGLGQKGIYFNSQMPLFQNSLLNLELDERLRPPWHTNDKRAPILFAVIYKNIVEGDILAFFNNGKDRFPAIVKDGDRIIFNFDPQGTVDFLQNEQYLIPNKLFYQYLPVHYHLVPGWMRKYIKRLLVLIKKQKFDKTKLKFPSWPFESSVETMKYILFSCQQLLGNRDFKLFPAWPGNKKYAVVLSHDIDTNAAFRNIGKFIRVEKKYNLHSCWFVVGELFPRHKEELLSLRQDGFEIGCHGYLHDNKLVSLGKGKMRDSILKCSEMIRELGVKGFRSPSLLRSRQLYEVLREFFLYDTSVPDTEVFLQIAPRSGCCTVFPYAISGKLLEVPITLPMDATLMALRFSPDEIFEIWKEKIEWIKKIGGMAHIATHAESHYSGNEVMLRAYERLLSFISESPDYWIANAGDVASRWQNG